MRDKEIKEFYEQVIAARERKHKQDLEDWNGLLDDSLGLCREQNATIKQQNEEINSLNQLLEVRDEALKSAKKTMWLVAAAYCLLFAYELAKVIW
jgi:hypothetical protein